MLTTGRCPPEDSAAACVPLHPPLVSLRMCPVYLRALRVVRCSWCGAARGSTWKCGNLLFSHKRMFASEYLPLEAGTVAQAYNTSSWEFEAGGS